MLRVGGHAAAADTAVLGSGPHSRSLNVEATPSSAAAGESMLPPTSTGRNTAPRETSALRSMLDCISKGVEGLPPAGSARPSLSLQLSAAYVPDTTKKEGREGEIVFACVCGGGGGEGGGI